ncbi:acyl-CoA thioesterase domain-containing protein [uncultured Ferrimonas sp.]|uniref:acyl-CoA thioesterase domain-containing protein n=1 Tax=uncultured Ferrimonas sp. TaxID=432640 RepID=UPI002602E0E9|nr:acyl-CoA thioesterase domain-containing protein [uncultured Ferrimonas sp.]
MSAVLDKLVNLLTLEQLDDGLYRGESQDLGFGHLFGGQVLGQALAAAQATVPEGRHVHSYHSYFLRAGDLSLPVIYDVETLRDGGSFSARRVSAIQHGRPIFFMTASFQGEEPGLEHQVTMPQVAPPEEFKSEHELALELGDKLPQQLRERYLPNQAIELRVAEDAAQRATDCSHTRNIWMRATGNVADDDHLHQFLLSYASDFNFLTSALKPHGRTMFNANMKLATIDHSMWFHRKVNLNEWLLFSIDCPSTGNARGLVRGQIFDTEGHLVASAVQEGLMRSRAK